ncbi:MAG: hypothetical protein ACLTE2_01920 [Eubacteriales bacterium]
MEDISEGTGDQDVLLKLDWSTLTATSEDDPNFNPDDNQEQSPAVDLVDTATGIKEVHMLMPVHITGRCKTCSRTNYFRS